MKTLVCYLYSFGEDKSTRNKMLGKFIRFYRSPVLYSQVISMRCYGANE